ncbi:MAG: DUF166 family (seleno)protein DfsP [Thermodesulfobacteriota bacterium]|nr:DUF166 family (seleno)protein DfsP [Thermodesulfobacteriota bacterium]
MGQNNKQKILVFEQDNKAEKKIAGIREFGEDRFDLAVISIDEPLPPVIEDSTEYLPDDIAADLVLDYLTHPDLSTDLAALCRKNNVPVIASGKKINDKWVYTPPICCALSRKADAGAYKNLFGAPEFEVTVSDGQIASVRVKRGAPCGASWRAAKKIEGLPVEDAVIRMGLETQFFCTADPAGWDPIGGKSPVHFAGEIHASALEKAIEKVRKENGDNN